MGMDLMSISSENPELRAILFCKTREMTEALKCWMHEDEELNLLNAEKLVGAHTSADRGGGCVSMSTLKF